jgi:hypothetical protein
MALRGTLKRNQRTPQRGAEPRQPAGTPAACCGLSASGAATAGGAAAGRRQTTTRPLPQPPPGTPRQRWPAATSQHGVKSHHGHHGQAVHRHIAVGLQTASQWCRISNQQGILAAGPASLHVHHVNGHTTSLQGSAEASAHLLQRRGRVWHAAERRHRAPVLPPPVARRRLCPLPCWRPAASRTRRRSPLVSAAAGLCCCRAVRSAPGARLSKVRNSNKTCVRRRHMTVGQSELSKQKTRLS